MGSDNGNGGTGSARKMTLTVKLHTYGRMGNSASMTLPSSAALGDVIYKSNLTTAQKPRLTLPDILFHQIHFARSKTSPRATREIQAMDVGPRVFLNQLPTILNAIAEAHFVAIDLELSGIPTRKPRAIGEDSMKPNLQSRYEETKMAAEKYQVLQLGITCVGEDRDKGIYTARPFNFFVNPVTSERLGVDRNFSYQSGAVEFLLSHGFRMDAPFVDGIPYLSRNEELDARLKAAAQQDRAGFAVLEIPANDIDTHQFMKRVRSEIGVWKDNKEVNKPAFLNIAPLGPLTAQSPERGLNGFQKRLVHQLVRAEYPEFVTFGRGDFIQLVPYDQQSEEKHCKNRAAASEERLKKSVGLRWLIEGLVGGDLKAVESYNTKKDSVQEKYEGLFDRLKSKKTILVGHNVFIDLIYFYSSFLGQLPNKVEDFQHRIHEIFPTIIDTKYLATQDSVNPALTRSSLEELDGDLTTFIPAPVIETPLEHARYLGGARPSHEAGFDSYLTAKVLIRLSAKLEAKLKPGQQAIHAESEDSYETAPEDTEDGGVSLITLTPKSKIENLRPQNGVSEPDNGSISEAVTKTHARNFSDIKSKRESNSKSVKASGNSNFAHATIFDLLGDIPADDSLSSPGKQAKKPTKKQSHSPHPSNSSSITYNPVIPPAIVALHQNTMMPPFQDDFWNIYRNRLRVNGTVEGICSFGGVSG